MSAHGNRVTLTRHLKVNFGIPKHLDDLCLMEEERAWGTRGGARPSVLGRKVDARKQGFVRPEKKEHQMGQCVGSELPSLAKECHVV